MMFTQGKIVGPFNPSQKEVFDNIYELLENMNSDNSNNNNNSNINYEQQINSWLKNMTNKKYF